MIRAPITWLISIQREIIGAIQRDIVGVRFAVNVFIGTTITWYVLTHILDDENPIWAIASMVAASDPQVKEAVRIFKSRLINVLLGCAVGFDLCGHGWIERVEATDCIGRDCPFVVLFGSNPDDVASGADYGSDCYRGRTDTPFQDERHRTWRAQGRRGHLWVSCGPVGKFVDGEGLAGGRA